MVSDVVILVHTGTKSESSYKKLIKFVRDLISHFNVSDKTVQVSNSVKSENIIDIIQCCNHFLYNVATKLIIICSYATN